MALLWIDGFDSYGTPGAAPTPTGIVGRKYDIVSGESDCLIAPGRLAPGNALLLQGNGVWLQSPPLTTDSTLLVGVAVKFSTLPIPGWSFAFLQFYDGTTLGATLSVTDAGELAVTANALLGTTQGLMLCAGRGYYLTLKVTCGNPGSYAVYLEDEVVLTGTGNTQVGTHAYHDRFRLASGPVVGYINPTFDDLYVCDSTGSNNNDVLGNVRVRTLRPDGAGSYTELTPDSGDNYARVNEAVCDTGSYVEGTVSGQLDTYAYGPVGGGEIAGVVISTDVENTDGTSLTLKTPCLSSGVLSDDAAQAVGTDYATKRRIIERDPATDCAMDHHGRECGPVWDLCRVRFTCGTRLPQPAGVSESSEIK